MFQDYELFITVPLRLLPQSGCTDLKDILVICPRYLSPSSLDELAVEISDGRGVLVLLEGWDERPQNSPFLDRIIDGQDLPASSVLITSRHAAAEALYHKVDRRIEIAPFSPEQREQFMRSYFGSDNEKSDSLIAFLSQRPDLTNLCSYPMILAMACFTCQVDGTLPSTMTDVYQRFIVLTANCYLEDRLKVSDRVSSIDDILNSPHFKDFCRMMKLALEGVRKNQFVFSDDDLHSQGIKLPTSGYNILLSCSQVDAIGVERGSHHYLHSSVQSCLAALELDLLDKEEQIKLLQECAPELSKKPYPPEWQAVPRSIGRGSTQAATERCHGLPAQWCWRPHQGSTIVVVPILSRHHTSSRSRDLFTTDTDSIQGECKTSPIQSAHYPVWKPEQRAHQRSHSKHILHPPITSSLRQLPSCLHWLVHGTSWKKYWRAHREPLTQHPTSSLLQSLFPSILLDLSESSRVNSQFWWVVLSDQTQWSCLLGLHRYIMYLNVVCLCV